MKILGLHIVRTSRLYPSRFSCLNLPTHFRFHFFLLFFIIIHSASYTQDTLITHSNKRIIAKILSIDDSEIKYCLDSSCSRVCVAARKDFAKLIRMNGNISELSVPTTPREPKYLGKSFNFIHFNLYELFCNQATFELETQFSHGLFCFKFPLSIGFQNEVFSNNTEDIIELDNKKIYSIGLEFGIYPLRQQTVSFYLGFQFTKGSVNIKEYYFFSDHTNYKKCSYNTYYIRTGFLIHLSDDFCATALINAGGNTLYFGEDYSYGSKGNFKASINFGYKF